MNQLVNRICRVAIGTSGAYLYYVSREGSKLVRLPSPIIFTHMDGSLGAHAGPIEGPHDNIMCINFMRISRRAAIWVHNGHRAGIEPCRCVFHAGERVFHLVYDVLYDRRSYIRGMPCRTDHQHLPDTLAQYLLLKIRERFLM